jgi:P-type Mg2+ transporter
MNQGISSFWSIGATELLDLLHVTMKGLTSDEASSRFERDGPNRIKSKKRSDAFTLFIVQFKSPIILILLIASVLSLCLHNVVDATIIIFIVIISGVLGFWQEYGASNAVAKLLAIVQIKATVLRDAKEQEIPIEEIVSGDIVVLHAGDIVPGDCLLIEAKDAFMDEAMLTGETFPVEKISYPCRLKRPLHNA